MAESYYELLRRPEWQKKRLQIMERDEFRCRECCDKQSTLNVHHGYYTKGAKPWEYPDESLRTLCEKCHERIHDIQAATKKLLGVIDSADQSVVLGFLKCVAHATKPRVEVSSILEAIGVALYCQALLTDDSARMVYESRDIDNTISFSAVYGIAERLEMRLRSGDTLSATSADLACDDVCRSHGGDCRA